MSYLNPMSKAKPTPVPLAELTPGQQADFFALFGREDLRGTTSEGKPYFTCRFSAMPGASPRSWFGKIAPGTNRASANGKSANSTSSAPSTANTNATARN